MANRYFELLPERPLQDPRIRFIGTAPSAAANILTNPIAPAQYYAELDRCLAFPRANFLVKGSRVMYDLYANPETFDIFGIADFVSSTVIPKPSFQLEPQSRANVFS